jgi:hypothetical protein
MRDEIDARLWVDHHQAFSEAVANLFAAAGLALKKLHQIQFDAPWRRDAAHGPGPA